MPRMKAVKALWDSLEPIVDKVKHTTEDTKAGRFISEASAELMKAAPDLSLVKRKITAAAHAMPTPSEALGRAQAAVLEVDAQAKREKKAARRKASSRKVTKKKTARKKTARKKTARKKTARKKTARKKTARKKTARKKTAAKKTARKKTARKKTARKTTRRKKV